VNPANIRPRTIRSFNEAAALHRGSRLSRQRRGVA